MLIVLDPAITPEQRAQLLDRVQAAGCQAQATPSAYGELLIVEGDLDVLKRQPLRLVPGVRKVVALSSTYTLSSLEHQQEPTVVKVGRVRIGGGGLTLIGGPCAVESADQLLETARAVKAAGADLLRGGAYKPRTSPYSFRGLGIDGLRLLRDASLETGLPTVSEVMDPRHVEACVTNVDMVQVGTRNMNNFDLLIELGQSGHPVLLKRGRSATITDWLMAAEYVLAQGNPNVVLCERGVRGFDPSTRNLLDLAAVAVLRTRTHLPVIVDPSHGTGHAQLVPPMARAAVAAGADGVIVEVHRRPEEALSDAEQALRPEAFRDLCEDMRLLASVRKSDIPSSDA
ncbi:MAG: 3-deoxy-7-phosphoheptulonate synthase [Planctomycetota bacterium]|nr:3-deoxy-7-phosphoheptulonate synthase [Planctomycetota bacterium]